MCNLHVARLSVLGLLLTAAACEFDDSQASPNADASAGTSGEMTTTGSTTDTTSSSTTMPPDTSSGPTGSAGEGGASGTGGEGGAGGTGGAGGDGGNGGSGGTADDSGATTTIDDSVIGTGSNQFNYMPQGGWKQCPMATCSTITTPDLYMKTNHWAGGADAGSGQTVTLAFNGTQLVFYGVKDPRYGIGAISMDNGTETMIDYYSAQRMGDQVLWTSPVLAGGNHTFKLRVTGMKNVSATDSTITVDRVDVR